MSIDERLTNDRPQSPFAHFGKFQVAISLQHIIQSTSSFILGWGFWGQWIERAISGWIKSKIAASGRFEKF